MSRLWDVWQSDVEGGETHRVEAPDAESAARAYASVGMLPAGSQVTARELSGSRERGVYRVSQVLVTVEAAVVEVSGSRERAESWAIPGEEVTP